LRLVAHTPGEYQSQKAANQNQVALSQFSSVLDLMALLNAQHRFLAVAMTLCNELAARHGVQVGAHPGYADREHFGRRELPRMCEPRCVRSRVGACSR